MMNLTAEWLLNLIEDLVRPFRFASSSTDWIVDFLEEEQTTF